MQIKLIRPRITGWLRSLSGSYDGKRQGQLESRTPEGTLTYAIGDVHGRGDLLDDLLERIHQDATATPHLRTTLVFLGDYIDRGLTSKHVIDTLVKLKLESNHRVITLMGNHEDAMLRFLADAGSGKAWVQHGGNETLHSYGVAPPSLRAGAPDWEQARKAFLRSMPMDHLRLFRSLSLTETIGDYIFVHAGVRPGLPLRQQEPQDLLWIRDDFLNAELKLGKTVVHGHTPRDTPTLERWRIGIDTGAYATGVLTALRLCGTEQVFLQTGR
jgi:serine/threonine protein phosphatase 1